MKSEPQWEEEILAKIDSGEKLTNEEIKRLVFDYETERDDEYLSGWNNGVYSVRVESICKVKGRHFMIDWYKDVMEWGGDDFDYQPVEVERETREETVTVNNWVPKVN